MAGRLSLLFTHISSLWDPNGVLSYSPGLRAKLATLGQSGIPSLPPFPPPFRSRKCGIGRAEGTALCGGLFPG